MSFYCHQGSCWIESMMRDDIVHEFKESFFEKLNLSLDQVYVSDQDVIDVWISANGLQNVKLMPNNICSFHFDKSDMAQCVLFDRRTHKLKGGTLKFLSKLHHFGIHDMKNVAEMWFDSIETILLRYSYLYNHYSCGTKVESPIIDNIGFAPIMKRLNECMNLTLDDTQETGCWGCTDGEFQPNQEAHMGPGGCLQ